MSQTSKTETTSGGRPGVDDGLAEPIPVALPEKPVFRQLRTRGVVEADMKMVAKELVIMAKELVSGLYSDVGLVAPDEMASQFAKYVLSKGGMRNIPKAKVSTKENIVFISGDIHKTPHAIAYPTKEGEGIGITVAFSIEDGIGRAEIKIWVGGRFVEHGADISRRSDTLERWILNISSYVNQLVDIHMS